jgi:NtrC-family two-component system response regulator AlgB
MSETRGTIVVVDDERNILNTLTLGLRAAGFQVQGFSNPCDALEAFDEHSYDIAFIDLLMQPMSGMDLLKEIRRKSPSTTCVIITAHGSIDSAVEAIKHGAFDFLQKPFDLKELQLFAEKVYEHHRLEREVQTLREEIIHSHQTDAIVTRSPLLRGQLELARQVADSHMTVLIEGESGTGKELVARYIHEQSGRQDKPFVKVTCAALPENLLESELFGHVRGAFTGAAKDRQGRFEVADGGTVFLDEISEIPQSTQVKLLNFLQNREFERVGENVTRRVDVRVIAATNRSIADALREGTMREDLFYRLNAVRITVPPLRARPEDIILLVHHFVDKFGKGQRIRVSQEALSVLMAHRWPGNVRELENVCERAVLVAHGDAIQPEHLPEELRTDGTDRRGLMSLEELERRHIARVLSVASDLEEAARVLGIDPATLWRKRKKFGL